jgi:membrane protease YdiL (CAAX protease family)
MDLPVISKIALLRLTFLVSALATVLSYGFLSSCLVVERLIPGLEKQGTPLLAFPLIALIFYLPGAGRFKGLKRVPSAWAILSTTLVAFVYGLFLPRIVDAFQVSSEVFLWFMISTPIGEELLFRGWLFKLCRRFSWNALASATNPLPVGVWLSAYAFAIWHFQNVGVIPFPFVAFQVFYTFFLGIWLGKLREDSGSVLVPIAAHSLINLATGVGMLVPRFPW